MAAKVKKDNATAAEKAKEAVKKKQEADLKTPTSRTPSHARRAGLGLKVWSCVVKNFERLLSVNVSFIF